MFEKIRRWTAAHPNWTLVLAVLAALVPFLGKPFNIDDPLFLWAGKQIQAHPADPFGFNVNWEWSVFPMWKVTQNPPVACYFVALAAAVLGWSEVALHAAFLLPALAVILGTHRLAKYFCARSLLAALITLFTPVFLVSSTTVMCDVLMLAFWVWAVIFWIEGVEQNDFRKLAAAGLLIALAEMTKYYGACLIPLLAAYGLASRRPVKSWGQFLLIPLVVLCVYQYVTQAAYGYSLLFRAMDFSSYSKLFFHVSKWSGVLVTLTFAGGCVATSVFFAPLLWRWRALAALAGAAALLAVDAFRKDALWERYTTNQTTTDFSLKIQMLLWMAGGLCVLTLTLADLWSRRDARALLLALWVAGTFVFTAFCNWTVNGRSVLPLAPAVAILIVRRLEQNKIVRPNAIKFSLAASAALALLVAWSDFSYASAVQQGAKQMRDKYGHATGTIWFQGHWGFQYYMQKFGGAAFDLKHPQFKSGDIMVSPANNINVSPLNPDEWTLLDDFTTTSSSWLSTWNPDVRAGFYAAMRGPLPFAFGPVSPEKAYVFGFKPVGATPPKN